MKPRGSVLLIAILAIASSAVFAQKPKETPGAVPALPSDIPASAERYSVVTMGNLAGQQAVWSADDGMHMFFQFNDRGRGPKKTSVLKLDSNGIPIAETVKGNDYLKSPVDET